MTNNRTDALFTQNQRLVFHVAKRFPMVDRADLIQAGQMGLWEAACRYDEAKGAFGSYAYSWIKCRMMELAMSARTVSLVRTREGRKVFGRLSKVRARMLAEGREVTPEALSAEIGVSVETVRELVPMLDNAEVSLSAGDDGETLLETLASGEAHMDEHLDSLRRKAQLEKLVNEYAEGLKERERTILFSHLMADEPETLESLGNRFGVTKQRMGQIVGKMRKDLTERAKAL